MTRVVDDLDIAVTLTPEWDAVAADAETNAANPFARLGVLPPGRAIRTVIPPLDRYGGPTTFESTVTFHDERGRSRRSRAMQTPEVYRRLRNPREPTRAPPEPEWERDRDRA